jgi:hypothetical protein
MGGGLPRLELFAKLSKNIAKPVTKFLRPLLHHTFQRLRIGKTCLEGQLHQQVTLAWINGPLSVTQRKWNVFSIMLFIILWFRIVRKPALLEPYK